MKKLITPLLLAASLLTGTQAKAISLDGCLDSQWTNEEEIVLCSELIDNSSWTEKLKEGYEAHINAQFEQVGTGKRIFIRNDGRIFNVVEDSQYCGFVSSNEPAYKFQGTCRIADIVQEVKLNRLNTNQTRWFIQGDSLYIQYSPNSAPQLIGTPIN